MKLLAFIILLSAPGVIFAQNAAESVNTVTPVNTEFDLYCLANATTLMSVPTEKRQSLTLDGTLPSLLAEGATYKEYGVNLAEGRTQYFAINGTDKVLAVKSLYILKLNYSNSKK